jgi:tyrosyl-tRNA synthetase
MSGMAKKMNTEEAENLVADILGRGVGTFVDPDGSFRKRLIAKAKGEYPKDIIVKFGMDPTRPDIHLGHAVVLRKLRQMQDIGCKIIFLIGDFTTLIGDPTGKSKVRPELDFETVAKNMATYLDQVDKILLVERDKEGNIIDGPLFSWSRNSDWFFNVTDISVEGASKSALTIKDEATGNLLEVPSTSFVAKAAVFENTRMQKTFLRKNTTHTVSVVNLLSVMRKITLSQLLERDMFQDRINTNTPLFMHEMLYPVAQGIDSELIALIYGSCDLEVGGTDQTFNLLMGRKIMEMTGKEPQAILSFTLLVGTDGKEKMSKSLDNYIGITDAPADMFGKIMSLPDEQLPPYFELCTFTPMKEVENMMNDLKGGKLHPKDMKMQLAQQVVEIYHGRAHAEAAKKSFIETFRNGSIPADIPEFKAVKGNLLVDVLLDAEQVASKSEFRRLIDEGAIRIGGEEKIADPFYKVEQDLILKIGKHRFIKLNVGR